jgi:hypothetical protein
MVRFTNNQVMQRYHILHNILRYWKIHLKFYIITILIMIQISFSGLILISNLILQPYSWKDHYNEKRSV